jgi:hypothetical protein
MEHAAHGLDQLCANGLLYILLRSCCISILQKNMLYLDKVMKLLKGNENYKIIGKLGKSDVKPSCE